MDPTYGARYRELYERHWWWRAREAAILELLARLAPAGGFGRILDVGCGDGLFFPGLARFGEPEGLEVEEALVTDAGRARGTIHVGPFDALFEPGHRFGLVTLLDVVEHLDDDVEALRHAARLAAPDGLLVITVPAFQALWTAHDDTNHHRRRYTRGSLLRAAREAGLEIRSCRYLFHWLFPVKILVRLKERLSPGIPAIARIPPPAINRFLYGVSRLEQRTWGHFPWPLGSSLLAVAEPA
jgi:SAM-dependent methyltransferase